MASWLGGDDAPDRGSLTESLPGTPSGSTTRLPVLVELVKADLVRKWKSGEGVSLEFYLETLPELGSRDAIPAELILAEYEERCRHGASPELTEYETRFPRQAEKLRRMIERPRDAAPTQAGGGSGDTIAASQSLRRPPSVGSQAVVPIRLPKQFGRYRIIKRLGQGAMGTVYLAHDSQLGRRVALKVPHLRAGRDLGEIDRMDLERFYREVRSAATLRHPNLCPVYDQGEIDGVYYVTMAYLKGRPLSALIDSQRPFSERWVAAAVRKLAQALAVAHNQGVIHRDLKPSNIMVTSQSELVIMDFGLAWQVGSEEARLTQTGTILGTPAYMSPEQLSGSLPEIGPQCDVYSLGVILYELLTSRRPYQGPTTAVMAQVLFNDPQPPSMHRPDLHPRLEAICLKAMAKKAANRYGSMAELAIALGQFLRSQRRLGQPRSRSPVTDSPLDQLDSVARSQTTEASALPGPLVDPTLAGDSPLPAASAQASVPEAAELHDHATGDATTLFTAPPDEISALPGRDEPAPERPMAAGLEGSERATEAGTSDGDSELRTRLRAWTAVVERLVLRRPNRRVPDEDYKALHGELIRASRARAETSDEVKRSLYERVMNLAQPWLTSELLEHSDREILFDLLVRCREADLELQGLPQAAKNLRHQIATRDQSANRAISPAAQLLLALGLCLGMLVIVATLLLAIW
jgi:serine/threonine protein kinase